VTLDAMGTRTGVARTLVERKTDDVRAVKGNPPWLAGDGPAFVTDAPALAFAEVAPITDRTVDRDQGRIEIRQVWASDAPEAVAYVDPDRRWAGPRGVAMVQAERRQGQAVRHETRYSRSRLAGDAPALGTAIRRHWAVESRLHWVLDVAFDEDRRRVRIGHAAENVAIPRRCALHLLCRDSTARIGIKAKRLQAGWDEACLARVLGV
jgi:predicted transposase YbfD/YdcC